MRKVLDQVAFFVMNAMADDWESLEQIAPEVEKFANCSDRNRIAHLLVELVNENLLREAEQLPYEELKASMILKSPLEFWFSMTETGRELWSSESYKFADSN